MFNFYFKKQEKRKENGNVEGLWFESALCVMKFMQFTEFSIQEMKEMKFYKEYLC